MRRGFVGASMGCMFDTILVATDASANEDEVFSSVERLALRHASKVVVVVVGAASSVSCRVHERVAELRMRGVHARLAVIADGRDKVSVIAHLATAWGADLMLVGGADGGLTQRILESSPCPVLAVSQRTVPLRPPAPAGAGRSPVHS